MDSPHPLQAIPFEESLETSVQELPWPTGFNPHGRPTTPHGRPAIGGGRPAIGAGSPRGRPTTRDGRPDSPHRSHSVDKPGRAMSPARTIAKKVTRPSPRPTMGVIAPVNYVKSLFQEEAAGPSKEPVFPSPSTHTLRGMKTPTGGYAKVFIPRVPKPDASIDESIDSTPPRRTVERVARTPSIKRPPGTV